MSRFFRAAGIAVAFSLAGCLDEPVGPTPELSESAPNVLTTEAAGRPVPVSCGQVITESVALANDLLNCPGNGLVVGADDIVIDGRGHRVDGSLAEVTYGVLVEGRTGVTLKNIEISDFTIGIGLLSSTGSAVLRNEISGSFLDGVLVMASHDNEVSHNDFTGNGIAINVTGSNGNRIQLNDIVDPEFGNGIQLSSVSGAEVVGNRIRNGGLNLQATTDSRIERNRIEGAMLFGYSIRGLSRRNVFRNNRVSGVDGDGFSVFGINALIAPAENTFIGNRASGNTGDGFDLFGATFGNTLVGNAAEGNGGFGFRDATSGSGTAGTANTYDRNRCVSNAAGPSSPAGLCGSDGDG